MKEERANKLTQWIFGSLILFVIYLLSYGPMTWIYYATPSDAFSDLYFMLYEPFSCLPEDSLLVDLIYWYEDFWD